MRYRLRYTKDEKRHLAAAERVLADPTAPPREVNAALRHIQRIQDVAEGRAFDRAIEPAQPAAPSIADLVSALEKAEKQPSQPIENKDTEKAETARNAVLEPPTAAKALEVTQTPETPVIEVSADPAPPATAFCGFCDAVGNWNTRYPLDETAPKRVLLCPTCYGKMLSADMTAATAEAQARPVRSWLYGKGTDPNVNDLSDLRGMGRDYQNSVALWEQQAREDSDRRAQEARERERAEAQYHDNRARWIQDGGRL